ncbi:MAG TPA: helix-turn-helix domain-containing protein [Candidatus Dormibacteraeota bacterium]|nr:helix-turn-helix domain-containing protein [Candidatus Dormibacteraeota bacterium]
MPVKRTEQPDLRSEHAAATRSRVLRAAKKLFAEKGYAATTIAALADEAGVAVQTLYSAFGSKAGIAVSVMEDAVISSGIREANAAALREPDGEKAVRIVASAGARLYSVEAVLVKLLSAEVAADFARISNRHRLQDITRLATTSAGIASRFRTKEDASRAAIAAWAVSGIETYDRLVLQAGWSHEHYVQWLGDMFVANLLPPRGKSRTSSIRKQR